MVKMDDRLGLSHVVNLHAPGDATLERRCRGAHLEVNIHPCASTTTTVHRLWDIKFNQRLINVVRLRRAVLARWAVDNATCRLDHCQLETIEGFCMHLLFNDMIYLPQASQYPSLVDARDSLQHFLLVHSPRTRYHSI